MKKSTLLFVITALSSSCFAFCHPRPCGPCRPMPPPLPHHGGCGWNSGAFWGGMVVGGLVGSAIYANRNAIVIERPVAQTVVVESAQPQQIIQTTTTTVPQQSSQQVVETTVVRTKVWVSGYYINKVINGVLVKEWIPGHYEWR